MLPVLGAEAVAERVDDLIGAWSPAMTDRLRIRQLMDGGREAIVALLGPRGAARLGGDDLPVAHLMDAGLQRLAQRLGRMPDVRVDPAGHRDSEANRKAAEKRQRLIQGLDYQTRLELTLPYAARWLPGYGFACWTITEGLGRNGERYAKAEVRNSFDAYPGQWGPDSQPAEVAFVRLVSKRKLSRQYPVYAAALEKLSGRAWGGTYNRVWTPGQYNWEGQSSDMVQVAEYIDASGTYLLALDTRVLLDVVPNPLETAPAFVFARRPSFNKLGGQYDHVIGLMSMMAKLNVLAYIATEDATFRETNIIGDLIGKRYERGRFATNFFSPGTQIERPTADVAFQTFTQIDRIERQLRIGANYPITEDAESPTRWVTGRGLDELSTAVSANVREYQTALSTAIESLDARRLEWEERVYGMTEKRVTGNVAGMSISEKYRPAQAIAGNYDSRRVYGVMAGWDEPEKIVTGLQLLSVEALDLETFQDNLDGLENKTVIAERNRKRRAENGMWEILVARAAEGDPKAQMALVEIHNSPGQLEKILSKFYTPEEPEMSPEEQMMAMAMMGGGGPPGGAAPMGGPPEGVSTVLSRILGGEASSGAQTVTRV